MFLLANIIIELHDWEIIFKLLKFAGVVVLGYVHQHSFTIPDSINPHSAAYSSVNEFID